MTISELQDRTRINEVYAQGATNLDSHDCRQPIRIIGGIEVLYPGRNGTDKQSNAELCVDIERIPRR